MPPSDSYPYRRVRRTAPLWWLGVVLLLSALAAWVIAHAAIPPAEDEDVGRDGAGIDSLALR